MAIFASCLVTSEIISLFTQSSSKDEETILRDLAIDSIIGREGTITTYFRIILYRKIPAIRYDLSEF